VPDFKKLWPNAEHASPYVSPTASPGNSAKVNSLGTPPTPNS